MSTRDEVEARRFDLTVLRFICLVTPWTFVAISWTLGSLSTAVPLTVVSIFITLFVFLRRGRGRTLTLHAVIAAVAAYQTYVLQVGADEPNVGVVWHLTLPMMVSLIGNRWHIVVWTPITVLLVLHGWSMQSVNPAYAHPMSIFNLVGAAVVIAATGFGITTERDRRERKLAAALARAQQESEERKQAEERATASHEAISRFLGSISHELRTPLTSIIPAADVIDNGNGERPEERIWTSNIRTSANTLVVLLNDVIDLARVDAGAADLVTMPFKIDNLLNSVSAIVTPIAHEREIDFQVRAAGDLPRHWAGNEARTRQVLVNLINNALKHAGANLVTLRVTRKNGRLSFTVEDDGKGIARELQDSVFEPFRRLAEGTPDDADEPSGTGLGLAISRGYVEAMGGELTVASTPGAGAAFSFSVDASPTDDIRLDQHYSAPEGTDSIHLQADDAVTRPMPTKTAQTSDLQCLICEDNKLIADAFAEFLRREGHTAYTCTDKKSFLTVVLAEPVNVVMLDLNLGAESGLDVLRELRSMPGPRGQIPVCVFSGGLSDPQLALDAGANDFLQKPCSSHELVAMAEKLAFPATNTK
ncbi:MAG: ATP-binding protein [Pseudomonadota bacterium]